MVGFKLVITLLCGLVWESSSAQCNSRTLTLGEYFDIADSELATEFCKELSREECITKLTPDWDDLNNDEFDRGIADYNKRRVWYPFGLCHVGPDLTGNQRKKKLLEAIEDSVLEEFGVSIDAEDEIDEAHVAIMENTAERLCAIIRMPSPVACNMADGDNIIVQPLLSLLKIGPDTILALRDIVQGVNASLPDPVVEFTLCTRARNNVNIEDNLEDVTGRFIDYVINESNDTTCKDTFENRLSVDFSPGDEESAIDPDILTVTYNKTDDTEIDRNCSIGLIGLTASLPSVCFLEFKQLSKLDNEKAQYITQSGVKDYRPLFDVGIKGDGQVVAVSDSGIDMGHCSFKQTSRSTRTQNNNQRKVIQYIPHADSIDDKNGHGTHVCGTVAGHESSDGVNEKEGSGNGVAPNAKIAFMDVGITSERYLSIPSDTELLNTGRDKSHGENAQVHSASWGTSVKDDNRASANGYTIRAKNFDKYMYQNPDFLILVAAGNDGRGNQANSVGTPATAKNILSVGAHLNDVNNMNKIASFSSRGPTQDGRIKPDLLAPGASLNSASAGSGCGLSQKSGTSMATPATAASAALVRQYFAEGWFPTGQKETPNQIKEPTGALVKAVLMNGAQWVTDVEGGGIAVTEYDNNQGFGRISLTDSIYIAGKTKVLLDIDEGVVEDGEEKVYNTTLVMSEDGCTHPEFRATLVWTDEPGIAYSRHNLVNDLDLLVIRKRNGTADVKYYPNGRMIRDSVNTAERVIVKDVKDGDMFEITVKGTNLAADEQIYAIAMTGCLSGVSFTPLEKGTSSGASITKFISVVASVVGATILAWLM